MSGRDMASPVAKGIARPWVVWNESTFMYPATRPVHPMPETTATLFRSISDSSRARAKQLTVVPMPQPGHQIDGMRSMRRYLLTGFSLTGGLIERPPRSPSR